jgi:hypothetical protein
MEEESKTLTDIKTIIDYLKSEVVFNTEYERWDIAIKIREIELKSEFNDLYFDATKNNYDSNLEDIAKEVRKSNEYKGIF